MLNWKTKIKVILSTVLAVPMLMFTKAVCASDVITGIDDPIVSGGVDVPTGGVLPVVGPADVFNALIIKGILVLGGIATLMVIYGGYIILMHGDNETEVKKGKTIITYAVVGIIVIALAASIVKFALDVIN
ncbi:hypothetical protein D4R87_02730 [bacterium]|nr:MAG: hypothetical protein D4R87_02730 [bacterium]